MKSSHCSRCLASPATYIVRHADGSGPEMRVCYQCVKEAIKPKYCNLKIERITDEQRNTKGLRSLS